MFPRVTRKWHLWKRHFRNDKTNPALKPHTIFDPHLEMSFCSQYFSSTHQEFHGIPPGFFCCENLSKLQTSQWHSPAVVTDLKSHATLPKINMEPQNWWCVDASCFSKEAFSGSIFVFFVKARSIATKPAQPGYEILTTSSVAYLWGVKVVVGLQQL